MVSKIEGASIDFFPKLLVLIANGFSNKDICILECQEQESGNVVRVLAAIRVDDATRKIEFIPIATLFETNPMAGLKMVNGGAILASQRPIQDWVDEAHSKKCNISNLN